ncbi:P1 family peptidase [Thermodesulfobacteriota bacterium]
MSDSSLGKYGNITDVEGVRVGHATDTKAKTGVTVILPPARGVPAGIHRGGNASSTRQMDSLWPLHIIERIHGVCLCGGSAFGLDAGGGVLRCLEAQGIGMTVVAQTIPIVPSAAIFDLNFGEGSVRPDRQMGFQACKEASAGHLEQGSVGAGTGATVGKLFGIGQAMKGGLGSSSLVSGEVVVGALVGVNAYGDVTDTRGRLLAGARTAPDSREFADCATLLVNGEAKSRRISVENTTLAVVAVNARLDKISASRIAAQASLGLGSVIRPFHSHIDGDVTMVMGIGELDADPNRIGLMAAQALQTAVVKAIRQADGFGILPAWRDLDSWDKDVASSGEEIST